MLAQHQRYYLHPGLFLFHREDEVALLCKSKWFSHETKGVFSESDQMQTVAPNAVKKCEESLKSYSSV